MKLTSTILAVFMFLAPVAFAQEDTFSCKVKITVLGTVFKKDIDVISNNLAKMPQMSGFAPSSISQKNVQFTGTYTGDVDQLVTDIQSLAADRFTVKSKNNKGELDVTLRKVEPNMPFTPAE